MAYGNTYPAYGYGTQQTITGNGGFAPQMYQPITQPANVQQNAGQGIIWVQGESGAKSYLVAAGNTILLMDSESQRFFIKSSDANGMPQPLRIFEYKETSTQNLSIPSGEKTGITREEYDDMNARITALSKEIDKLRGAGNEPTV